MPETPRYVPPAPPVTTPVTPEPQAYPPPPPPPPLPPQQDSTPLTILLLGIFGFMFPPLGPVAVIMAHKYMARCRAQGVRPDQNAVAGQICGIVATVLLCIFVLMFVIWIVFFVLGFLLWVVIFMLAMVGALAGV